MSINWRTSGQTTFAAWDALIPANSEIKKRGESRSCFDAAGSLNKLCLGMLKAESSFATHFNAVPAAMNNPLNLRIRGQAPFQSFGSITECINEWRSRITSPSYAYRDTQTVAQLVHIYAPSFDNNNEVAYVATVESVIGSLPDAFTSPVEPGGPTMPTKPTIFITAGHRSDNDSGNPNEKDRTDDMARAYRDVFTAAGFSVHYIQNEDGDGRPDITTGGLDTVGQKTRSLMLAFPGNEVLFDCHFEGAAQRGVFAIVPDETGLSTAVVGGEPGNDTWENNPLDVALARSISRKIAAATGLPLRQTTEPGVMSERATGVGGQGYRLAMMAYTVPVRDRAVRLVVEHGSIPTGDFSIINSPGFYVKCAGAALAAVNEVYGLDAVIVDPPVPTTPPPPPKPTGPAYPKDMTRQIAEQRFEKLEYTDGDGKKQTAQFDEDGPVSRAWLANIAKQLQPGQSYLHANIGPIVSRTPRGKDKRYVDYGFAGMPTIRLDTKTGKVV